jgi:autotransporter adhesin
VQPLVKKDGKYGVDVVQSGGTTINNVATATKSDQAVNKGQVDLELAKLRDYSDQGNTKTLNTANSYTDRKVEELQSVFTQNMGKLEDKLGAGVAGAMAMASLAQTTGRGTWALHLLALMARGFAWGMNGLSEDGKYIIKSAASFDTQGNIGGSISFNRQF